MGDDCDKKGFTSYYWFVWRQSTSALQITAEEFYKDIFIISSQYAKILGTGHQFEIRIDRLLKYIRTLFYIIRHVGYLKMFSFTAKQVIYLPKHVIFNFL